MKTNLAKAVDDRFIEIIDAGWFSGEFYCIVDCRTYEEFRDLPKIIELDAGTIKDTLGSTVPAFPVRLGLTGWNSDTWRAHYYEHGLKKFAKGVDSQYAKA